MWNLESVYPENPSEWFLTRIALDVRLMRSDIYMTFNLIKNTVCLHNDPSACMCVVSSKWCWSFLYVPSGNTGHLHWRCGMNTTDTNSCPWTFGHLRSWRYSPMSPVFLSFPLRFTIHLELTFVGFILFHLDGQLIKQDLLKIYLPPHWYWVRKWMNESQSCPTLFSHLDCTLHGIL